MRYKKTIFQILPTLLLLSFYMIFFTDTAQAIKFTPQVDIDAGVSVVSNEGNSIGQYIRAIYNYAIGIVGILATVVMMIGGIVWITAGGNNVRISEAKSWIGASLTGLVLALTSYTILAAISPNLVSFGKLDIDKPDQKVVQPFDLTDTNGTIIDPENTTIIGDEEAECNPENCRTACMNDGYTTGACDSEGKCNCSGRTQDPYYLQYEDCATTNCRITCQGTGYSVGTCVNNNTQCECSNCYDTIQCPKS